MASNTESALVMESVAKIPINLTGVSETVLSTLRARAEDADKPAPFLGDTWANTLLSQLDYSPRPVSKAADYFFNRFIVGRARLFDRWTAGFLAEHLDKDITVLQLACGLDSRALRLDWHRSSGGSNNRWIDVDVPEVMGLRKRVFAIASQPEGYSMLEADVTSPDSDWLEQVPADRPTLVIMEGLLMYLEWDDIVALFRKICDRFPTGQILADVLSKEMIARQQSSRALETISKTGVVMKTGIDSGAELVEAVHDDNLRVREQTTGPWDRVRPGLFPIFVRLVIWMYSCLPRRLKSIVGRDIRFDF